MKDALEERIRSAGYTPRARELPALLELLSASDEDVAARAERALARGGAPAATLARNRFEESGAPLRQRLVDVVARIADASRAPELLEWVVGRASDPEPRARRRAIVAIGKLGLSGAEPVLLARWEQSRDVPEQKALAAALGKIGSAAAGERLRAARPTDPELARVVGEAALNLERRSLRESPASLRAGTELPEPTRVLLHVRSGLEELLLEELKEIGVPARGVIGRGRVELVTRGPLSSLFRARTFLHLGFPLEPETLAGGDVVSAVVRALASDAAWRLLRGLTEGPVRYRLEWPDAGRSRATTLRVAERVRAARPDLVNDPTRAPWEAVVTVRGGPRGDTAYVELWPRALADPRFDYRLRTVPASSHPTIAAALARVSGVEPGDVVWDPFVGAGLELVERALLGPYRELIGTDTDAGALEAARENLSAARIAGARLGIGDAASFMPTPSPTLIITNPPFGKRVLSREAIPPLFGQFLASAARNLERGGRLVWVSPAPGLTAALGREKGLRLEQRIPVDLAGPKGEIQRFVRERR